MPVEFEPFLYLSLNVGAILVPFLWSFHPRIRFDKQWRYFFPALLVGSGLYLVWDVVFTYLGVWGFNDRYLIGLRFLGLPLEEWLFFLCIPYASIFTFFVVRKHCRVCLKNAEAVQNFTWALALFLFVFAVLNADKVYTLVNFVLSSLVLVFASFRFKHALGAFYVSFLLVLVPFFLVNGVLTGSWIAEPVVWYDAEIIGFRLGSIPIEDAVYALGLLLLVGMLMERRS